MNSKQSRSGFSLIAMILVIMVASLAVAVSQLNILTADSPSKIQQSWEKLNQLKSGLERFRYDHDPTGYFDPITLDELHKMDSGDTACAIDSDKASAYYRRYVNWCGPYVFKPLDHTDAFMRDAWGTLIDWDGSGKLVSCGPSLTCGDGDDLQVTY